MLDPRNIEPDRLKRIRRRIWLELRDTGGIDRHTCSKKYLESCSQAILWPLPTATPKSAGLCALGAGSIVALLLTNQRSDLTVRPISRRASVLHLFRHCLKFCCGGCAWDTFGCAGFLDVRSVNPRTAATLFV